ncbi:hypothetical protein [Glycomyces sp. MUSA5-2]|uniref:hypothetical protein n=1 Tax=Glycomyces sp. MUSA5-2 TaxID=2053002 RepID=UPI00300B6618
MDQHLRFQNAEFESGAQLVGVDMDSASGDAAVEDACDWTTVSSTLTVTRTSIVGSAAM